MDIVKVLDICSRVACFERNIFQLYDREMVNFIKTSTLKYYEIEFCFDTTEVELVNVGLEPAEAKFIMIWINTKSQWNGYHNHRSVTDQWYQIRNCIGIDKEYPYVGLLNLSRIMKNPDKVNLDYYNKNDKYSYWKNDWIYLQETKRSIRLQSTTSLQMLCLEKCINNDISVYNHLKDSKWKELITRKCVTEGREIPKDAIHKRFVW